MKKCTSSALTLWNVNTVYHLTTSTSLKNTMSWLLIQISIKLKLRRVIWKLKFLNCNKESGYPYVVNIDTANRANPVDGKIIMSNLCSEILQVQEPSLINDAQEFVQMGTDVSCNLGSTNVVNMMTSPDFGRSIRAMVRALTFVTDSSHIVAVPTIDHGNKLPSHTFGLGAMGLHSYLAQQLIEYGSPGVC